MELNVFNTDLNKSSVLDTFDSLIWRDRYSKAGDFEIYTTPSAFAFQALREDYYLSMDESDRMMIIESLALETDVEEGNKFIIKGRSLESILNRRIVWKQTVLGGSLHNGIKQLLNDNAIDPEDPDRKILRLVFEDSTDPAVTSIPVDQQFTGDNLLDVIESLCEANSIGFKITLSSDKHFVFKLYAGADRSFDQIENPFVAFSPDLENLTNSNYYHSKSSFKTITLVGGEGEGSDRVTAQVALNSGASTDLNRREKFTDARDVSSMVNGVQLSSSEYNSLLVQRGLLSLLESLPKTAFDGQVDPNSTYKEGVDFFLGDIVQIENEYGLRGKARVTELIFSENLSAKDVYPTFQMIEE